MSDTPPRPLIALIDVPASLGLLSRLPVPIDGERAAARSAEATWAYPVAGVIIGGVAALVASAALWIGLPIPAAALLALAALVIVTGAMHEDGLADSADGLWGGWDPARRLEIMKDSRIGVYGVAALALSLLLRWIALTAFVATGLHWAALITAAAVSRACVTGLMAILPHARQDGLSAQVGRPGHAAALIAAAIALVLACAFWGWWGLLVALMAELTVLGCAAIARAKIGGQTGDILGAAQQMTELAVMLTLLALINNAVLG